MIDSTFQNFEDIDFEKKSAEISKLDRFNLAYFTHGML